MKLANYLKQYRKENNLTQQELADKLFVSKQAVSKWETERGLPDIETYKSLSTLLNVSVDELLGLENVEIINDRAENIKNRYFDIVTARAVSNLSILLELCIPLVKVNGYFIGYKGSNYKEELDGAKGAIKALNVKLVDVYEYDLEEYGRHSLIKFLKDKETNKIYPRPYAQIKKKPL